MARLDSASVTGLCVGNSPGTGEFPAQMASNAENVSIWWRHHAWQRAMRIIHNNDESSVSDWYIFLTTIQNIITLPLRKFLIH